MYNNSTAVYRPDINAFLQQAQGADKYFIADKVFPVLGVGKRAGQYPRIKIGEGSLMRKDMSKRNATGTYNEMSRKHSWDTYSLADRGLKERIDDDKAAEMQDFFDLEVTTGKLLTRNMNIDRLWVTGIVTEGCVELTARDAADRGYYVTLVSDACASSTHIAHDDALQRMGDGGLIKVRTVNELIGQLAASQAPRKVA